LNFWNFWKKAVANGDWQVANGWLPMNGKLPMEWQVANKW